MQRLQNGLHSTSNLDIEDSSHKSLACVLQLSSARTLVVRAFPLPSLCIHCCCRSVPTLDATFCAAACWSLLLSGSNTYPPGWYHLHDRPGHARYFDGTQLVGPAKQPPEGWTDAAGYTLRQGRLVHASDAAAGGNVASGQAPSGGTLLGRLKSDRIMQVAAFGVVLMAAGALATVLGVVTAGGSSPSDAPPAAETPSAAEAPTDVESEGAGDTQGLVDLRDAEVELVDDFSSEEDAERYSRAAVPPPADLVARFEAGVSLGEDGIGKPCTLLDQEDVRKWADSRGLQTTDPVHADTGYVLFGDSGGRQHVTCTFEVSGEQITVNSHRAVNGDGNMQQREEAPSWARATVYRVGEYYVKSSAVGKQASTFAAGSFLTFTVSGSQDTADAAVSAEDLVALLAAASS